MEVKSISRQSGGGGVRACVWGGEGEEGRGGGKGEREGGRGKGEREGGRGKGVKYYFK